MAVTICVTSSRFRSAVKGMAGVMTDSGGNSKSSVSCVMNASSLRAYACYREDSLDHSEQPLENGSRKDVVPIRASPAHVPWCQVVMVMAKSLKLPH
jgi:hypothetical protein